MEFVQFLRQFRIGPYAIFDLVMSYIGIFLVAPVLSKLASKFSVKISRTAWLWFTLPISVIFHLIFRQNTAFMQRLFSSQGYHVEVIVLLFMVYMGVRHIYKYK